MLTFLLELLYLFYLYFQLFGTQLFSLSPYFLHSPLLDYAFGLNIFVPFFVCLYLDLQIDSSWSSQSLLTYYVQYFEKFGLYDKLIFEKHLLASWHIEILDTLVETGKPFAAMGSFLFDFAVFFSDEMHSTWLARNYLQIIIFF